MEVKCEWCQHSKQGECPIIWACDCYTRVCCICCPNRQQLNPSISSEGLSMLLNFIQDTGSCLVYSCIVYCCILNCCIVYIGACIVRGSFFSLEGGSVWYPWWKYNLLQDVLHFLCICLYSLSCKDYPIQYHTFANTAPAPAIQDSTGTLI